MRRSLFVAPLAGAIGLAAFAVLRAGTDPERPRLGPNGAEAAGRTAAAVARRPVQLRRRLLPARGRSRGQRPRRSHLPRPPTSTTCSRAWSCRTPAAARSAPSTTTATTRSSETLKTFALDLTGNPSLGQLLNQARGEKVEVTLATDQRPPSPARSPASSSAWSRSGSRTARTQMVDVDVLNLVCARGPAQRAAGQTCSGCASSTRPWTRVAAALEVLAGGRDDAEEGGQPAASTATASGT